MRRMYQCMELVSWCQMCVIPIFTIFFFKQKTAYEMRISDWSSDVCSSDLLFVRLSADEAARLRAAGFDFYDWGEGAARLVVSWDQDVGAVAPLAAAIAAL